MAEALKQSTINFELVSPEARLMSGPVKMAVIPGEAGEMGVGAGHASFIVSLQPGVVKLYSENDPEPRKIFITGGFADVTAENCVVLAEEAVNVNTIDAAEAGQSVKNLTEDLAAAREPADMARIARQLKLAKARLQAITGKIVV